MSIVIVPYEESLKESLFAFYAECFPGVGKPFEPDGRHEFYNHIPEHFERFWCLTEDNTVLGSVAIRRFSDDTAELKALYLSEELRGHGWGYKLLNLAVEYVREQGYKRVCLDSMKSYTAARRLYDKYGFREIGSYNNNTFAEVFMELRISDIR